MEHNSKNSKGLITAVIILSFISAVGIILSIFFIHKYRSSSVFTSGESVYSDSQISDIKQNAKDEILYTIKDDLSSGRGISSVLRDLYPDNVVYSSNSKYIFADINKNLKLNTLDNANFNTSDSGEVSYSENGSVISHKGIDVSRYQGDIDFSKVKASGVEYAILRCGYRSYGSGILTEDSSFSTYVTDALSSNLNVGVYFFTQAINTAEAKEEADFVLDMIRPYRITYPVVLDVEKIVGDTYRQQDLTVSQLTDVVVTFCDEIKRSGYTPMIYGNLECFIGKLDLTRLENYEKWFAYYDDTPYFPYEMSMWQYTESGTVDGISGKVDMDITFKTW